MPLLERRRLLADSTLPNDAGTFQFQLPRAGLIDSLEVWVNWTNGSTSCQDQDIYDEVDRIELIANGNRVLHSLTGQQARCWAHTFLKHRPPYVRDETPSVVQQGYFFIPFGWFIGDPNHYLDCSLFSSVELRITYSPTIAVTSFATGTGQVVIYANMWHGGAPGPNNGFLRIREQTYFTSAASGDENYDLPLGDPFVALGLYVYEAGIDPSANITDFELEIDDGAWSLVVGEFEDLNARFSRELGINPDEWGIAYKSNTDVIETRCGTLGQIQFNRIQSLTIGTTDEIMDKMSGYAGGQATIQSWARDAASVAADAANTTDGAIKWFAQPKWGGLGNFLVVPIALQSPDTVLNSAQYGRIRAKMTQGNAGAEVRLSLIELARQ